jgi:GNAT superfamily N-acetyltransferase
VGPDRINGQQIEYHLTRDIPWLLQYRSFAHLYNPFMNEDRLAHAEFVITADLNGVTGGIVIAERLWGSAAEMWGAYPDALQIGGLFVDQAWRKTPTGFRLGEMAAIQAAKAGRVPVAVTETRSDMSRFLNRSKAVRLDRVQYDGADCARWDLRGIVDPVLINTASFAGHR